jgi:hypothetical protein
MNSRRSKANPHLAFPCEGTYRGRIARPERPVLTVEDEGDAGPAGPASRAAFGGTPADRALGRTAQYSEVLIGRNSSTRVATRARIPLCGSAVAGAQGRGLCSWWVSGADYLSVDGGGPRI